MVEGQCRYIESADMCIVSKKYVESTFLISKWSRGTYVESTLCRMYVKFIKTTTAGLMRPQLTNAYSR